MIHLGYEMGSGEAVEIPLKHLAITGQTQEAGKTTALEALVTRSGLTAVSFTTKRGEGAFHDAHQVQPYFRDQGDWQFVAAILEASRGEKLKFERSWIIRASRGCKTLADVHRTIKDALKTAKGLSESVYTVLDAYLDVVVPVIQRVQWAPKLTLKAGAANVVDLTDVPDEMQHLVIKSTLEYVLHFEKDTIVVVPEAWKFIPQGRNTPVKLAAASYIRQGAALKNYLWLDSQDLGGIDKEILRSVAVWLIGVQREANEIKRTLENIPEGTTKPNAKEIAWLGLGQFYACWSTHAIRTYVQPTWDSGVLARRYAMGHIPQAPVKPPIKEQDVHYEAKIDALERAIKVRDDIIAKLEGQLAEVRRPVTVVEVPAPPPIPRMKGVITDIADPDDTSGIRTREGFARTEDIYQEIKARLVKDAPALLRILVEQPSIEVTVERPVLTFEPHSLKGRIVRLMANGFFNGEGKTPSQIRGELKRHGPDANTANIGRAMDDFVKGGCFRDEGVQGYRIVDGIDVRVVIDK